jgi:peptidyl-prolyl cis-trans isomerase B (cyclophilin B)
MLRALMRLLRLLLPFMVLLLVAAGCGGDNGSEGESEATTEETAEATPETTETGCQKVDKPESKGEGKLSKPTNQLDPAKTYVATVSTTCGDFEIELDVKRAPKTTASFAFLAEEGFYDNTTFHRIIPGFVIQGGDPLGTGTGGPGYSVVEAPPKDLSYTRGVVAMAKGGTEPFGASGSQFFVVTGEDVGLPPQYALLGKVIKGQEVVDTIGTSATDGTEQPIDPVVIESVTIAES